MSEYLCHDLVLLSSGWIQGNNPKRYFARHLVLLLRRRSPGVVKRAKGKVEAGGVGLIRERVKERPLQKLNTYPILNVESNREGRYICHLGHFFVLS